MVGCLWSLKTAAVASFPTTATKLTTLGLPKSCGDSPTGRGGETSGFGKDVVAEPSGSGILDGRKKRQGGVFSASPRLNDDYDRWLARFRSLISRTMLNGRSFGVR